MCFRNENFFLDSLFDFVDHISKRFCEIEMLKAYILDVILHWEFSLNAHSLGGKCWAQIKILSYFFHTTKFHMKHEAYEAWGTKTFSFVFPNITQHNAWAIRQQQEKHSPRRKKFVIKICLFSHVMNRRKVIKCNFCLLLNERISWWKNWLCKSRGTEHLHYARINFLSCCTIKTCWIYNVIQWRQLEISLRLYLWNLHPWNCQRPFKNSSSDEMKEEQISYELLNIMNVEIKH